MNYPAPSYLTGLVTNIDKEILAQIQRSYGENTTAFKLDRKFNGFIQTWNEEFEEFGDTIWGIDTLGNKILLFDQYQHGYNGVMQVYEKGEQNTTKHIYMPQATEVVLAFQYIGDEEEYIEEGTSKHKQDYFGWIAIYKLVDNKLEEVTNFESA